MADRMNIKFTIQAVDRFSANMKKLGKQLDTLQDKADKFDINRDVQITADTAQALNEIKQLQQSVNKMERQAEKAKKIKFKTKDATAELERMGRMIGGMSPSEIDIDVDTRSAFTQLRRVDDFLLDLRRNNTEIKTRIDVDTGGATRSLNRISDIVTGIGDKRLKIEADTADAIRSINDIDGMLRNIRRNNTEIRLSAEVDTSNVAPTLQRVARMTDSVMNARDNYELGFNILPATTALNNLNALANGVTRDRDIDVGVDMAGAFAQMTAFRSAAEAVSEIDADVNLRTAGALREMMTFRALASLPIVVTVRAEIGKMRSTISSVATLSRNAGEAILFQFSSMAVAFSTSLVPILAVAAANLAHIGVIAGVAGGAALGLASAFVFAGGSAAGFAAVAIPSITKLHETIDEIDALDEKIQAAKAAGDMEKAAEAQAELTRVLDGMTDAQKKARVAMGGLSEQYSGLVKSMEPGVLTAYGNAMVGLTRILEMGEGVIEDAVATVVDLTEAFNANIEAADMKAFFAFLDDFGGDVLESVTKSLGNFIAGFLNVMTAFGPLSLDMSSGLLEMSESFRKWTAGLSESTKFQAFVDYVRTNWPKVKEIFGDGILGMIEMLSAFAPSAESFIDNLVDMMNRFREWAQALGENKEFQEFLDYVIANGPRVTSFIGSMIDTLVSLGEALAPLGEVALQAATKMFEFFTNINENYPIVPQLIAGVASIIGALGALILPLGIIKTAFNLLWPIITLGFTLFMKFSAIIQNAIGVVLRFLPVIGRIGMTLLRLAGPIGIAISLIILIVTTIYQNWGTIGPWIKEIWGAISDFFVSWWAGVKARFSADIQAIKSAFTTGFTAVKNFIVTVFTAVWDFLKWFGAGILSIFTEAIPLIWSYVVAGFTNIKTAIQEKMNAAKTLILVVWEAIKIAFSTAVEAVKTFVTTGFQRVKTAIQTAMDAAKAKISAAWSAIKSFFSSAVETVKSKVSSGFDTIRNKVQTAMDTVSSKVSSAWSSIKSFFSSAVDTVRSKVSSGFDTIKSKVQSAMDTAKSKVSSAWSEIKSFFSTALSNIVTAVKSKFESIVNSVKVKMMFVKAHVTEAWNEVMAFLRGIDLAQIGRDIIDGLIGGIKSMASNLVSAAKGVVEGAIDGAKALLGIKSPSRVFRSIGEYTMQGMQIGVESEATRTVRAVSRVADAMTKAFKPELDAEMAAAGTIATHHSYTSAGASYATARAERARNSKQQIEVPVYLNGREIARASADDVTDIQSMENDLRELYSGGE